ncbi:CheY-like receiver and HTH DNA-binding domain-containing response regulator [Syntrophobacter sp. SbD1]|nr:CheY-like receiver and HTH DNA-binding domain-containing response regulator [Syntrophobacter sp. SbD1]
MRLAIIEDNRMLRENLRILLNGESGIDVVGAFGSAEEALSQFPACSPEVLLVDLGLPGISGVELIEKAREEMPSVEIMAYTIFEDRETVFAAIKAGASGYILKGSSPREIVEALHSLNSGGAPMSPRIARKVIGEFQENAVGEQYLLSPREKEILMQIEAGLLYKQIADKLAISPHTVHSHIKKIYEKLHAQNRQDALVKARRKCII